MSRILTRCGAAVGRVRTPAQMRPPLGIIEDASYLPRTIALSGGDMLLLYTDGVTEAENTGAAQFGMKPFEETVLEIRGHPARAVVEHVIKRAANFAKGAPQSDDITCVAVVWNER
jgi:sigma-B regulation protein RsbU (phosphoserine phosphatase)